MAKKTKSKKSKASKRQTRVSKKQCNTKSALGKLLSFVGWLTGVIVSLAVGFGMIGETLSIPQIYPEITIFFGWVVVVTTILGALLAIIHKLSK